MLMFRGINEVILDAKGRMAIPTRYRNLLEEKDNSKLVVTIDTEDKCLLLYPFLVWEEIEKKVEALPSFNKLTRRIQRLLIGHATEVEFDGNGRILVPPLLREYAHLDKNVILVGQGKKFEIWAKEVWDSGRDAWLAEGLSAKELPSELQTLSL